VVAVERSTSHSVLASWKPILLDTARRYHEYHATIHWKHESGWSVGIGWLISDRSCTASALLAHMDPPRTVSVFKLGLQVVVSVVVFFFCSQNSKRMNKHLIWVFRELVVLLNNLEEGRNVDTISDCMINHELEQMSLYFLFSIQL